MNGLSIVIPTYNRFQSLVHTINSIIGQDFQFPLEIIIIDQNQNSGFKNIFSDPAYKNCKLLYQKYPNVSSARNFGFNNSKYDLLLFLDDDLIAPTNFLNRAFIAILNEPQIECLVPFIYTVEKKEIEFNNKLNDSIGSINNFYIIKNAISAAFFIRRNIYLQVGGFDPYLFDYCKSTEDNEFFIRLRKHGVNIYYDPKLEILHLEEVEGGCELRKELYIINRFKFIKGWTFRHRVHKGQNLRLTIKDHYSIMRLAFLNRKLLSHTLMENFTLIKYYIIAVADTKKLILERSLKEYYKKGWQTNHLNS